MASNSPMAGAIDGKTLAIHHPAKHGVFCLAGNCWHSAEKLLRDIITVICDNGNVMINVGAKPDGRFDDRVYLFVTDPDRRSVQLERNAVGERVPKKANVLSGGSVTWRTDAESLFIELEHTQADPVARVIELDF